MTYHGDLGFIPPRRPRPPRRPSIRPGKPLAGLGALFESVGDVAVAPLSVKYYPTTGAWASYQSAAADATLRGVNQAIGSLGFPSSYDGLIRDTTATRVKLIATWALQPTFSGMKLVAGGTVGHAGTILASLPTAEAIAKRGTEALWALQALAGVTAFRTFMQSAAAGKATTPSTTPGALPPDVLPPPPPGGGAMDRLLATLKTPLGMAAVGVGGLLLYTATRGGGRRRR